MTGPHYGKGQWALIILGSMVFALVLLLTSCGGEPPPESGIVVNKQFEPAHWESGYRTEYQPQFRCRTVSSYSNGKSTSRQQCGVESVPVQVYEAQHRWVNDNWRVELKACKENDKGEEKCRKGWRSITEHDYERHDTGDYYPKTDETP